MVGYSLLWWGTLYYGGVLFSLWWGTLYYGGVPLIRAGWESGRGGARFNIVGHFSLWWGTFRYGGVVFMMVGCFN